MSDSINEAIYQYQKGKGQKLLQQLEWLIENKILIIEEVLPTIKGDFENGFKMSGEFRLVVKDKELIETLKAELEAERECVDFYADVENSPGGFLINDREMAVEVTERLVQIEGEVPTGKPTLVGGKRARERQAQRGRV